MENTSFNKREYQAKLKAELGRIYTLQGKLEDEPAFNVSPVLTDINTYLSECANKISYKLYKISQED